MVQTKPIVALHGFTGGAASWLPLRELLPSQVGFLAPDLPGHAGWPGPLPSSFETTIDCLAGWVADRTHAAHLVGYSLGARLALGLVVKYPDLFRSAVLIGVRPGLADGERQARISRDELLAEALARDGLEAFVEHWESLPLFATQRSLSESRRAEQRRLRLRHDPSGLAWALRVLSPGRMPDYRRRLDEIRCPVRVMVGELDTSFLDIAHGLVERAKKETLQRQGSPSDVEIEVVPGVGHNLPLEAPEAVVRTATRIAKLDPYWNRQPESAA
ncbi:MAG: alpha/beta fold hydrolase [Thermoanaerobaculia bacterium]|nr:alpha/beta fold hydrolase [Thermoanaerobaculia bacterium]